MIEAAWRGKSPIATKQSLPRQAFTLVEMIAALSALLVIAVAASSMLGSITDIGIGYRHSLEERSAVRRFAEVFRADVRQAVDVVAFENGWPLELVCPEHVVEYRWDRSASRLIRLVRSGSGGEATDALLASDVYSLTERSDPEAIVAEDRVRVILRNGDVGPGWTVEAWR